MINRSLSQVMQYRPATLVAAAAMLLFCPALQIPAAATGTYTELYSFGGSPGEPLPATGLVEGNDGNLYVNTYGGNEFFRIEVKDGNPGAVTKLLPWAYLEIDNTLCCEVEKIVTG